MDQALSFTLHGDRQELVGTVAEAHGGLSDS